MVTERLGKKRPHSGKTFSCGVDTSGCSFVLITCLYFLDVRHGENAPQNHRMGERLGKIVTTEAPPTPSNKGE